MINENFTLIRGDARCENVLKPLLRKADVIIPLAAIVGAPACDLNTVGAKTVNYEAIELLNFLRSNEQKIIFPTTNSGYGIGKADTFCDENTPLNPISLYGRTKVDAEKLLLDAGNVITFRLATVFGFSQRMRLDLLVNDFVYKSFKERVLVLYEAHFRRNFIHIRDVARAFAFGIQNYEKMKNNAYNVGLSSANLTKLELAKEIKKHSPSLEIVCSEIGKDPDKRDYVISNDKIEKIGYKTKYSLHQGIRELLKGFHFFPINNYYNL